jgi:HSP20 family protein
MNFLTRFDRWEPFEELTALRNRMDRVLSRIADPEKELFDATWAPITDVVETKDAVVLKAEIPGLKEKDISIEVENGVVTIQGQREFEGETESKGFRRIERAYGKFLRSFTLPPNVEPDKIHASYVNGLLEVVIPKSEVAKPKKIKLDVPRTLGTETRKIA